MLYRLFVRCFAIVQHDGVAAYRFTIHFHNNSSPSERLGEGFYLAKAIATPPSTFNMLPVDFDNKQQVNAKQAFFLRNKQEVLQR